MPSIAVRKLAKKYSSGEQEVIALSDINLDIREGEFVCILGPSGCGKSTLLEIIAGLQKPTSGELFLDEIPITGPSPELGVVFQDPSLFQWRTIRQNVELGLEIRKIPGKRRAEIAERYLGWVNLQGFENKYPHQLSGGMRQRAGLARTLANDPKVLLMDEPFGAVDHLVRLQLQQDQVDIWQRDRKTVVFVTHDVHEAAFLADRVILLSPRPGKVQRIFTVALNRPRSRSDLALLALQDSIYNAIYEGKEAAEPEYVL